MCTSICYFLFFDVVFCSNDAYFDVVLFDFDGYIVIYFFFSSFALGTGYIFQCPFLFICWFEVYYELHLLCSIVVVCNRSCYSSLYLSQVFQRSCFYGGRNFFSSLSQGGSCFPSNFFQICVCCGFPFFSNILVAMSLSFFPVRMLPLAACIMYSGIFLRCLYIL